MKETKPCVRCKGPKLVRGRRLCGLCTPLDIVWPRLQEGPGGCWLWPGRKSPDGYGCSGKYMLHRVVYEYMVCEIPSGLDLDHLCLVKLCVNPWHLEPVSRGENSRRKYANQTHCKNGHEFTAENTYFAVEGPYKRRHCRKCGIASTRRYLQRKAVSA